MRITLVSLGGLCIFCLPATAFGGSIIGLGVPAGVNNSRGTAISADGSTVVGVSYTSDGSPEAFRWTARVGIQLIDGPASVVSSTLCNGVSGDGSVVVGGKFAGTEIQAFRWTQENSLQSLSGLPSGSTPTIARGVSADGSVIVGVDGSPSGLGTFRWTVGGGAQSLGDLSGGNFRSVASAVNSDGSIIAGVGNSELGDEAIRWTEAGGMIGLGDLPGGIFLSEAYGISGDGSVVVGSSVYGRDRYGNTSQAFRWTESGGMEGLGFLGGSNSFAFGASADGSIIVGADSSAGAFIWTEYGGMQNLQGVMSIQGTDLTGWQLYDTAGVSEDGRFIVGTGTYYDVQQAFLAEINPLPVPEPATIAALGLGGLWAFRRRLKIS